ncbi:MAG: hypothetical protein ACUVTU_09560 [Desulfurispora sp.]
MKQTPEDLPPKKRHGETQLFTPFATERMEDYAALTLSLLIVLIVLMLHQ